MGTVFVQGLPPVLPSCCSDSSAKEHLEVWPGAVCVSPEGPEHPPALAWLWVLPRRHLTCRRQAASPNLPIVLSLMERDLSREGEEPRILRELPCLPTPALSLPLGQARAEHFQLEAE